jgi:hypothetical protein
MSMYVWHDGKIGLHPLLSKLTVEHGSSVEQASRGSTITHWCGSFPEWNTNDIEILNHVNYASILLDEEKMRFKLQLHQISYVPPQQYHDHLLLHPNECEYLIPVFLMNALTILQQDVNNTLTLRKDIRDTNSFRKVVAGPNSGLIRRIERYAIRAVYALGMDFACVYLRLQRSGKAVITKLDINPIQSELVQHLFAHAINVYAEHKLTENSDRQCAVFGMDPEFLLRNKAGKIVPANRFLQANGRVGYDSATVLGRKQTHPLVELRPEPSHSIVQLVNNLRRTMWHASKQITDQSLQWIAGGMPVRGLPLGGHVHISGIKLYTRLVRALDNYLALPLIMIEDHSTKGRRKKYGKLGDVRRPFHGGFEYRTLPSWIVSPRVTKGILALTYVIVMHDDELLDRPLDHVEYLNAYLEGNKHDLEPIVRNIWQQVERTSSYHDVRMYLDPLKLWVMEQRIWNEQLDFRMVWRIPPFD